MINKRINAEGKNQGFALLTTKEQNKRAINIMTSREQVFVCDNYLIYKLTYLYVAVHKKTFSVTYFDTLKEAIDAFKQEDQVPVTITYLSPNK